MWPYLSRMRSPFAACHCHKWEYSDKCLKGKIMDRRHFPLIFNHQDNKEIAYKCASTLEGVSSP
jgi:phage terminase large subunit-like protein